jgi:hypothetical protein
MAINTGVYGNTSSDATSYSIGSVSAGSIINGAKFTEIFNAVNTERSRRGQAAIVNPGFTGSIEASDINALKSGIEVAAAALGSFYDRFGIITTDAYAETNGVTTYYATAGAYTGGFAGVSAGILISSSHINDLISKLNGAASVCVCNCNYCTCNCNYCTCNCNYSCTCNCNYSDKRLKTNIEKIGVQNGFNIYTYNYIWDKTTKHTGVMAQEVLKTSYKHAIKIDKNGYYMVNYSALPITIKGL